MRGKIGIYGRSLGGIAATYLAKYVDITFVDRSFSGLEEVVEGKFYGTAARLFYNVVTCCQKANSHKNFLESYYDLQEEEKGPTRYEICKRLGFAPKYKDGQEVESKQSLVMDANSLAQPAYKVIFTDKNDEIVVLQSSMMVGVAEKSIEKQYKTLQIQGKPKVAPPGILNDSEC